MIACERRVNMRIHSATGRIGVLSACERASVGIIARSSDMVIGFNDKQDSVHSAGCRLKRTASASTLTIIMRLALTEVLCMPNVIR